MKIICIKGFRDKTTAKNFKDQKRIKVNDILDCDDKLAKERIKLGFAKEYIEQTEELAEEVVEETKETVEIEEKPRKRGRK